MDIVERHNTDSDDDVEESMEQSEEENSEEEICVDTFQREFYIGKEKTTRWYLKTVEPQTLHRWCYNIIPMLHRFGPQGEGKNANTHLKYLECF